MARCRDAASVGGSGPNIAQVRYTGVEFGSARLIPEFPAETLRRRFGDCKDKSPLLIAALRASGIDAYLALLSAGDDQDVSAELPGLGMFNHAIVLWRLMAVKASCWLST